MGHTKYSDLKDLEQVLEQIRTFENIKEKSPGVFYYKSVPFLHFHDKDGVRWADTKTADGYWKRLDIDFKASTVVQKKFLKEVVGFHKQLNNATQSQVT